MKRSVFEATDENILNSIKYDQLQRSSDVKNFLAMVDTIDYNAFISIDAAWGDGKTFFVRQVEMTMKYHTASLEPVFKSSTMVMGYRFMAFRVWLRVARG